MGLRGIENSVTEFDDVLVPAANVIGEVGQGLKIALSTLNTGRLSLPAMAAQDTKHALKIAREWAAEREQWGRPIGEHDPIAQKIAFMAGDGVRARGGRRRVASRMADDERNDIRIEAAIAKLYASELCVAGRRRDGPDPRRPRPTRRPSRWPRAARSRSRPSR